MINWKTAKKYWLKTYQNSNFINKSNSEEECLKAEEFVNKYASKIRWAKTICELGVGIGKHLNYFLKKYPNKSYFGNDFNPGMIEIIKQLYPNIIEKCEINIVSTDKYLKKYIKIVDAIFTYDHLMYIPEDLIDFECTKISTRVNKYILIHEINSKIDYKYNDIKSFIRFGFGRDYTNMFDDFNLKEKDTETVIINNKEVEFNTYLFKKIG